MVGILTHPDETANRYVYTSTATTTPTELLAALEDATGEKWKVEKVNSKEKFAALTEAAKTDFFGAGLGLIQTAMLTGHGSGKGDDNELLGVKKESVESVVKRIVKGAKA